MPMTSSSTHIGQTLRALRESKALSQEALAAAAGISRKTLVNIEQGHDAQVSSIESAARVLGVELGIVAESPELARRRKARTEQQTKLAASREKHLKIAVQFALGGPDAQALKAAALHMVGLWKDRQLCSPVYIERWTRILDAEPQHVAQSILALDDEWGPALRQNTPFALAAS